MLAYEDFAIANSAEQMLNCLESAFNDVQNALGDGGLMYPENVPAAASLLVEYSREFEKIEEQTAQEEKKNPQFSHGTEVYINPSCYPRR
jgi:hypothetical protein